MFQLVSSLLGRLPVLSLEDSLLSVVFCALSVHLIYHKYEVDPANFLATFALLGVIPAIPCHFVLAHLAHLAPRWIAAGLSYFLFYAALGFSIILYRISPFHPLANYPGPLSLKMSKFSAIYYASDGKQYRFFKELHEKYGPYIRVGPNELSFVDVDTINPILGVDGMRRGPQWIAHNKPGTPPNLVSLRDVGLHRQRRKMWNRGFTSAAVKDYQPSMEGRVLQLAEELDKHTSSGTTVDLAKWLRKFTIDFMGDMVFDGGLETMREGDKHGVMKILHDQLKLVAFLEHIPWITNLLWAFSFLPRTTMVYYNFARSAYYARKKKGSTKKDMFHFITDEDGLEREPVSMDQALNDIGFAMVAGADTTSTVLGGIFYYILAHPATYKRLQAEVDDVFPPGEGDPFDTVKLAEMSFLNAVINETLRLQPPLSSSLQRAPLQGSGGKLVAGMFVPENTGVYIPPYVLHRDERYFSPWPDRFMPERWLNVPSSEPPPSDFADSKGKDQANGRFMTNTAAYIPFSFGPANCAGKILALLEMRMVVALLVQRFEMRVADGYELCEWEESLGDFLALIVGRLPVVLTPRAQA